MFTEKKTHSFSQNLKQYFKILLIYSVILSGLMLAILSVTMSSYQNMSKRMDSLEIMYDTLLQMTSDMQQYGLSGDGDYLDDYSMCEERIRRCLGVLSEADIGGNYARNLSDFEVLYGKFQSVQQELTAIYSDTGATGTEQEYYSDVYARLETIWESMARKETIFQQEISEDSNQNRTEMEKKLSLLIAVLFADMLTFFLLFWRLTDRKAKEIRQPLEALTMEAQRIQEEPLEHFVMRDQNWQSSQLTEINMLSEALHTMLEQIQRQILELQEGAWVREQLQNQEFENLQVKQQLETQKVENLRVKNLLTLSELQGLQMHMNPHFLFNTLNMIRQNAYLGETDKTVHLLEETAALLRYNLSYNGKTVTLAQELEGLDHYLCIQEERFEERVAFEFSLEEQYHQIRIPCFILQPFVENSITHGMKEINGTLTVWIRTAYSGAEHSVQISIEDDGRGMDEERLAMVRQEMMRDNEEIEEDENLERKSIGLNNVYRRLMLFTENQGSLTVSSAKGKGTKILMKIPYSL
ncbi:MAG: histidine kinase [Lachnospiraceae bacterium]|nr:histidine kinase [Lachnospiraceae bacterium]